MVTVDVLNAVREGCAAVATAARFVRVVEEALPAYAASLPLRDDGPAELDPESHYLGHGDGTLAFILTLDAINFGSGYFPHLEKEPGRSGYFTVATRLTRAFDRGGPFSAGELRALTAGDCREMFGQSPDGGPRDELMALFAQALNDLGAYLLERFAGSFASLVAAADGSAAALVAILAEMPFYRDVELYHGRPVPFYKRAQLTAADLATAFGGGGPGHFRDLDRLTIFADNLVPHVLRLDGVLAYEPSLVERIESGELIPRGSLEEVEIRACALHAVESLVGMRRELDRPTTAMQLDYLLWNRGQGPAYKARPRHRTRTVFY